MAIPVSSIVNVTISLVPQAPSRAGFGTYLFVTTDAENAGTIPLAEGVRTYANMEEISGDWTSTDEVYKAANTYFSQSPRPSSFAVGARDAGDANVTATLDRLYGVSRDWYAFGFEATTRDDADVTAAAAWVESKYRKFYTTSNDANSLVAGDQADILFDLNAAGYTRTFLIYSSTAAEYPEVSCFGREATVNYDATDSIITLNLKNLPGITPETLTSSQLTALKDKGGNVFTLVGGSRTLLDGRMVGGPPYWSDTITGVDWLQNAVETNIFGRLIVEDRIPYTDAGAAIIEQEIKKGLDQGVRNGLIAPGTSAVDGTFYETGYSITMEAVADQTLSNRQNRIGPPGTFYALGAGAIHGITIAGTFEG